MEIKELNYPPELPVTEHRAEILAALRDNPVVIVCGDTGSGKTTQLPKMALELGRAARGRRIACTQPRRLAAVTMAERVAAELKAPVGGLVGFRHRFGRRISSDTRIEFMTDGVLLAETRFDPLLRAYDAIIVDEAHERSLNVDFLLGILKRILARRRDLKIIVSSATLDAARFSAFFDSAPALLIPGRLYPIEIGYRPPPDGEEADLPRDVAAAVAELPAGDDILVFLPGERDIRETADYLSDVRSGSDEIIPLLASLPAAEQQRAFRTSSRRRIILSTNVAETSVTIPGIRAVIDSGLARISRYVHRTQIQRLQIEPISQASARQRTGRCGRVGPGICLRLYAQEDFDKRDAYTPPEILRSSLAGVILTMLDLHLGNIERFPFIDPPKPAMIREGLKELLELGAIRHRENPSAGDEKEIELTETGRKLAKIPVEPRLAKMMLAASRTACLPSVLPLVAALSCDDPRRRPIDEKEKSDQAHAPFRVPGSDFSGTLKLWNWWQTETKSLSQAKARKLCKATYLSFPKMREWRDLTLQLESLARRLGLDVVNDNADSETLHRAILSGLLGHVGKFDTETRDYRGAHGLRFALHPSSVLAKTLKRPGKSPGAFPEWIMAGELVDTSRLFARNAAIIDVRWLESVAGPICKHSYHTPEWDPQSGFVRVTEQVTLYGLVIVPARRCDCARVNPPLARDIFIRRGILDCAIPNPPPQLRGNLQLLGALRKRAERARHPEFFDESKLFDHFNRALPADVCSTPALRKWFRRASARDLEAFQLKKADWWPRETSADRDFPSSLRIAGAKLSLSYRNTPDDPESDGITCSVARADAAVLRLWQADWLVPGLLPEKVSWMLATLPSSLRRALAPLDETRAILLPLLQPGSLSLEAAVRNAVSERWGIRIPAEAWRTAKLPSHLQIRFRIRDDETGRTLAVSRDVEEVLSLAKVSGTVSTQPQSAIETSWRFGTLALVSTDRNSGWETTSYLALKDEGTGVTLRRYARPDLAADVHAGGVARLYCLALAKQLTVPFRRARIPFDAALYLKSIDYADGAVTADLLAGAIRETLVRNRPPVCTEAEFQKRLAEDRAPLVKCLAEMSALLVEYAALATRINGLLEDERLREETVDSVSTQLAWLLYPGFLRVVPLATLRHYRRYLKGAVIRLERARQGAAADLDREAKLAVFWERYREAARPEEAIRTHPAALREFRWMIEEYRVSLFAQELHTPEPVSPKRLDAYWNENVRLK